jgi:hypothetical protein
MIYLLLVLYQIKHFVCDYPLQTKYMLGKFKPGYSWILPLTAHSGVHALATFLIALCFKPKAAVCLALFDFTAHFIMDRIKASPSLLGRFMSLTKDNYATADAAAIKSNTFFWWSLGLDQGVHHLTHYAIIWSILR